MAEQKSKAKDEREASWWADWWDADYSWDGLAEKKIEGSGWWGEETLADYWRRCPKTGKARTDKILKREGELIEFDGRWWHIVHLPLRSRDNLTSAHKFDVGTSALDRVKAIVAARLAVASETAGEFGYVEPAKGLVFVPMGKDGRARFDGACLPGFAEVDALASEPVPLHLSLDQAYFAAAANFSWATFGVGASFAGAFFSGSARFGRAKFADGACMIRAVFSGKAHFDSVLFGGDAALINAVFCDVASFNGAKFSGYADFAHAEFMEIANFGGTNFSGVTGFSNSMFLGDAGFGGAKFDGHARFLNVEFCGDMHFNRVCFEGEFEVSGWFRRRASFRNVVFAGPVAFAARVDIPELSLAGAFHGACFCDVADFSRSGPVRPGRAGRNDGARMAIAFAEAIFEKTLILTDGSEATAAAAFCNGTLAAIAEGDAAAREDLLNKLEAGCRTVKIAMGKARDEAREQRYYRFQLQARHARADTHFAEKFFGRLYGLVSGYGGSLGRPLAWQGGLVVVSALTYWLLASALAGDTALTPLSWDAWAKLSSALNFSFSRSLFLSAWPGVPERDPTTWQYILLNNHGAGWGLVIRMLAAAQSILSGILVFLFALAVRRKFQIGG